MSDRGSGGGDNLSGSGSNVKTIGEVKSLQIGLNSDKGEYYSTVATVVMFQKDKALYPSCTQSGPDGKGCNKKVGRDMCTLMSLRILKDIWTTRLTKYLTNCF